VRARCHALASRTRARILALTGLDPICPNSPEWFAQMFAARLPVGIKPKAAQKRLYDEFKVEVPLLLWNGASFIRVSFQAYNDEADAEALIGALYALLRLEGSKTLSN
jgi:isopenicillin-N epimerase